MKTDPASLVFEWRISGDNRDADDLIYLPGAVNAR
jgi:hypothetical protein